jgi:hypothetical protein
VALAGLTPGARILEIGAPGRSRCNTFSDHRALPEPDRTTLFEAMANAIERAGGEVRRRYETVLIGARKR